jgi:hypothetical protein
VSDASTIASAASARRSAQKSAMAAIQNAANGTSVSNDVPFTTNVGTARKSSVAHSGSAENRRASDHMEAAAINEKARYAAWNGTSLTLPKTASKPASIQPSSGGWVSPRRSTVRPRKT